MTIHKGYSSILIVELALCRGSLGGFNSDLNIEGRANRLPGMKVLHVSVEVSPYAKVGGLADVAGALPKAIAAAGHDVRVIMPLYKMIEVDPRWKLKKALHDFEVRMNAWFMKPVSYYETKIDGVTFGFVGTDEWFGESVDSHSLYQPGGMQHLFLAAAVMEICERKKWIPNIVHSHDWHTGFVPVLIRERGGSKWNNVGTVFTIHNNAYQGEFGLEALDALGMSHELFHPDRTEAWGRVNFLKSGAAYADQVNTVSETYAREIQTPQYGETLEGLMSHLARLGRLHGIVNGIDIKHFDPATDPALPKRFDSTNLAGKAICKSELRKELGLEDRPDVPLVGMISRLSDQKGYDLVVEAADKLLGAPIQLVVLAIGDPKIAVGLREVEAKYPGQVRFVEKFDTDLAQRVYAGSDVLLMPSRFEPCGLGQLIAMRYGTVPIVRATGGLADTVQDGENGFTFNEIDANVMAETVIRMAKSFADPAAWSTLVQNGMNRDSTWTHSSQEYIRMYERAIESRKKVAA